MAVLQRRDTNQDVIPLGPFAEFDRLAGQLRAAMGLTDQRLSDAGFTPLADIEETDDAYIIELDLPGVRREDVNVEFVGRRLVISGERKERERKGIVHGRSRRVGQFRFEVVLPDDVDHSNVEAEMIYGTLSVRVPKSADEKPKKITVK